MKKNLCKMALWIGLVVFGLASQSVSAGESSKQMLKNLCQENSRDPEVTFLASSDDLFFDQGTILLNVEGQAYSVHSLQKVGDQWLARVSDNHPNYCIKGHHLCRGCGLCHDPKCYFYIRPCGLWK